MADVHVEIDGLQHGNAILEAKLVRSLVSGGHVVLSLCSLFYGVHFLAARVCNLPEIYF